MLFRSEILTLGVLPAFQHHGLARLLMKRIIQNFRESCVALNPTNSKPIGGGSGSSLLIHANVSTSNSGAIKFYERMGMKVSSPVIRNLYRTLSSGSKDAYLVVGVV